MKKKQICFLTLSSGRTLLSRKVSHLKEKLLYLIHLDWPYNIDISPMHYTHAP